MARLPRLSVPGHPHHALQRGNNRQPTFHDAADYERLLLLLAEQARSAKVAIHSYVLMPDHFHVLSTPQTANGLSVMMQGVGRRYVRYFNQRHQRSGGLWEGRFRSTVVESERYFLACMAYLDLNPVRAGIVTRPSDYRWSSYGHYAGLRNDPLVTPHPLYWQLANTPFAREAAYAELVSQGLSPAQQETLRDSVVKGWALGEAAFVSKLQKQVSRRLHRIPAGRPKTPTRR